ncbi:MAG: 5-bromo-4-chloroindolyl phosphate hydrolysis family protein [Rhodobacter sp.]|nr:5-bromo-4-chloroindolyl phosphate hydrolysis family protein [Rhodobacter sp.]
MAQRFGGKYSPEGAPKSDAPPPKPAFHGKRRTKAGGRVNLLFLAPMPLVVVAFFQEPLAMAQYLVAFGMLILAAWLTREGILAQEAYEARKIAKRPAIPRKIFASVLTGVALGFVGLAGHGPIEAVIFAVLGLVLHFFSFGPDPLTDKGAEGIDQFQSDRVARAVGEAEKHLKAMSDAILRAEDRGVERRVEQFQTTVRDMFRTVEEDPRDLSASRKYLSVYLVGARDASVKFADLYARTRDGGAKSDYLQLLDDLERNFAAQTEKLLSDDRTDLDIEIDVLRDRLAREGVTSEPNA